MYLSMFVILNHKIDGKNYNHYISIVYFPHTIQYIYLFPDRHSLLQRNKRNH